ncbi:MAG: transglutaminase domain-containing protein, partial [Planctomycetes bacterium]|nr:transglutaminase domain-containing protein [Planctomycetota bacterium]
AITLFITLNVGWVLGSVIYQRQGAITLLGNFWKNQTALLATPGAISQLGFSRNGRLGTISDLLQSEDLEITLRITSSQTPGYLRAQTFDSYLKGQWHSRSRKDDVRPNSNRLDMSLGEHVGVYRIRNRRDARAESMVVRHVTVLGDATFLPLSIFELAMRDRYLLIDDDFVVFRPQPTTQTAYTLKYSQTAATDPLAPMHRKRLLRLTDTVRNELGDLAASLYRECVTTEDKIKATTEYFKANYAYSLAMPKLQGGDPLISFIKRGQVGYCEYFASGAALLLRQAGVPTRYVTGFYVTEKENVVPNSWVARNNDAHAWVEAWDDEREAWQIVEATVQNALTDDGANLAGNERGLQRFVIIQHLMQALYHYGVLGILVWLYGEGGLLFQFSLSLALALGVILTIRKAKRKGKSASMSPDSNSRQWHALRKTHARLERRLKRNGLQRQPHETLLTFARNIATVNFTPQTATSIQQWYTQYNQLRYSKATGEQLEQLTHALRKLLRQLRAKRREG